MFVLTVDQQGSRRVGDRVDALLRELAPLAGRDGVVRAFERTVGDEVQAVLDDIGAEAEQRILSVLQEHTLASVIERAESRSTPDPSVLNSQ